MAKKPELIPEGANIFTATFELKKFEMNADDLQWRLKMVVKKQIPHVWREYTVRFSINEKPYDVRIADLERKRTSVETEESLFADQKKTQLKNIAKEIADIEAELKDMQRNCPEIEFDGTIEEIKHKNGDTAVAMLFPTEILPELNKFKSFLTEHYKVELIRD